MAPAYFKIMYGTSTYFILLVFRLGFMYATAETTGEFIIYVANNNSLISRL